MSVRRGPALLRRVFQAAEGLAGRIPLGGSERGPLSLGFSIKVGQRRGVGRRVTRAQTRCGSGWWLSMGRTGGLPTPGISKTPCCRYLPFERSSLLVNSRTFRALACSFFFFQKNVHIKPLLGDVSFYLFIFERR